MVEVNLDKVVIHDIETLKEMFCICLIDYKSKSKKEFIIYDSPEYEDQPVKLYQFLKNCVNHKYTLLGFNNIDFDAQILNYFYEWCCQRQDPLYQFDNKYIIDALYKKAQEIISKQNERFQSGTPEYKLFSPQIDLYKQQHYDRPQKRTSLKWLQFTMRMPNIQEMPIEHDVHIELHDIPTVVKYCWNDVDSTLAFFERIKFETELRLKLGKEYKKHLVNAPEPRMAREIFGKFLCDEMGIPYSELKEMKTLRDSVALKDVIFPYVKFHTPQLQKVLEDFRKVVVNTAPSYVAENPKESESKFNYSLNYNGLKVDLGLGGIHSCISSGIYVPADDELMIDSDGVSYYPNLAIENDLRPEHLGVVFSKIYKNIFEKRKLIPKSDPINYIYKIILNSAYGLSREINSYFYDSKFCYGITINGQLSLLMLCEALYMSIPDVKMIQKNTDGITYIIKKKYLDKVEKIWEWWEKTTRIKLEHAYYSKMVILDVNNYMAVTLDGKAKKKGSFETEMFLHKNPSYLIIPKAIEAFFLKGTPVRDFIMNEDNSIYDFCAAVKGKSNFKLNLLKTFGGIELIEEQQKVTRFFVSQETENSGIFVKDFNDGRRISVLAGQQIIPCNTIVEEKAIKYPINWEWYIIEVQKILDIITPKVVQQKLF